jgi:hypothetical protein
MRVEKLRAQADLAVRSRAAAELELRLEAEREHQACGNRYQQSAHRNGGRPRPRRDCRLAGRGCMRRRRRRRRPCVQRS